MQSSQEKTKPEESKGWPDEDEIDLGDLIDDKSKVQPNLSPNNESPKDDYTQQK